MRIGGSEASRHAESSLHAREHTGFQEQGCPLVWRAAGLGDLEVGDNAMTHHPTRDFPAVASRGVPRRSPGWVSGAVVPSPRHSARLRLDPMPGYGVHSVKPLLEERLRAAWPRRGHGTGGWFLMPAHRKLKAAS
jgi:hypothetical protein